MIVYTSTCIFVQNIRVLTGVLVPLTTGFGGLVVLGLKALCDSISVYIGPSPKEGERKDRQEKYVQTAKPAPTVSAIGP